MIQVFCDGGSRGNPGPAAYGFVVCQNGLLIKEGAGYIGIATNNFAEYTALIKALTWLSRSFARRDLDFFLDSLLVVMQVSGKYKVKNAKIRELLAHVRQLETSFGQIRYHHIERSQNEHADKLVNLALDNHAQKI